MGSLNRGAMTWRESVAGTNGGATVTHDAVSGYKHLVTRVQASGDAAALVTVESPAATVLYRKRFAGAFNMSESFDPALECGSGATVVVRVSASTSNSESNAQGFTVLA